MVNAILSAFPDARIHSGYARIRCPYHKEGRERKPSMSVLLEPRGNCPAGFCHCFACGKVVDINTLLKDVGLDIQLDTAASSLPKEKGIHLTNTQVVHKTTLPFRKSQYLESRGIGENVQRRFRIYEKDNKVHMPIFDRDGFYIYDNARSTVDKRFFIEAGARKTLWGIEEIDLSKPVAVCESQIDAMSFWQINMQAVATLGADNIACLSQLKSCTSVIILAFDPDEAGIRARDRAAAMLGKFRCKWLDLPQGVDVNQALQDIQDETKFKRFMQKCTRDFVH
nr:MAG TPA: DNA directed DNA polymerase [Caudoviricetes sp.]